MHNEAVYQAIEALDDVLRQLKKKKKNVITCLRCLYLEL